MVKIDGIQNRIPSFSLRKKCKITVAIDTAKFFFEKQNDDIKYELTAKDVLYEDDVIIVVNKPAFFPTEETIVEGRDNLHAAIIRYLWNKNPSLRNPPYVGIMHRLDRETSGVILFTKSRSVNPFIHDMFEKHTAHKVYRAVTVNPYANDKKLSASLPPANFKVDNFLGRISAKSDRAKWGAVSEKNGGVHAHTDFTVVTRQKIIQIKNIKDLSSDNAASFYKNLNSGIDALGIEARPLTGRTHQIRVHLAGLGLPLLGDELYGGPEYSRIMLHALSLTFPHPVTNEMMTIEAPLPDGFI
ncbi:MAG: RluA family pseudouridine synthase [Treponema sp.]|nr:RluA family pseudouridine synthase [Treponema sp.]